MCRASTAMGNPPKFLNVMAKEGSPFIMIKIMLGCEEKILGRVLPPFQQGHSKVVQLA